MICMIWTKGMGDGLSLDFALPDWGMHKALNAAAAILAKAYLQH